MEIVVHSKKSVSTKVSKDSTQKPPSLYDSDSAPLLTGHRFKLITDQRSVAYMNDNKRKNSVLGIGNGAVQL